MFWRDLSNLCFISNILGSPFGGLIIYLYLRISKTKDMAQKDNKLILYKDIEGQVKRQ